jgi:cell cycle checkpoint protein
VEEFPNTFSRSSSALQSFRRAVTQYLQAVTPSIDDLFSKKRPKSPPIVPVIMIISETLLSTTTAAADSFTAHRLLGPEILNHPGTTVIEFNKIAPTFMSKALDLVLQKEADKSGRKVAPGPAVLKHLSETGDVRSAISALEFFCLHQGNSEDWSGKIRTRKAKKVKGDTAITPMEKQSLQMITQRESTLGIFHAVGKVVYNKREHPKATDTPPPQPPSHFPQHARPKVSEVNIETLINELGTDIDVFIAALHENYVLSCGGLTDEDTLDTINGCIDSLSDSDLLSPDRFLTSYSRYSFRGTTTDSLRQDEISFETSVRGILFHLPYPVKRATPPKEYSNNRGKGLSHATEYQMLYPTSMRLWRRKEQIEELVNLLNEKFRNGQFDESVHNPSRQSVAGGVDSWAKHARFSGGLDQMTPTSATPRTDEKIDSVEASFLVRGAGRSELLLERFPFMSALEKRKKKMKNKPSSSRSTTFKQLDKLTSFGGLTSILTNVEDEPEAEEAPAEQWSTDKPVEDGRRDWKKSVGVITTASDGHVVVKKNMESLVLSDDDIEDE